LGTTDLERKKKKAPKRLYLVEDTIELFRQKSEPIQGTLNRGSVG